MNQAAGYTAVISHRSGETEDSTIADLVQRIAAGLENPEAARNPFYLLAPAWALIPLVGLATLATVIASQAVISGAFSLTHQAIQLGYIPRMHIQHTSSAEQAVGRQGAAQDTDAFIGLWRIERYFQGTKALFIQPLPISTNTRPG